MRLFSQLLVLILSTELFANSVFIFRIISSAAISTIGDYTSMQEYINTNTEFIEKKAYEYGFNTLNTIINMDGAEIDSIEVVVTGEKNMDKCMELKLELSELYELDLSQIKVYWRKK